MQQDFLHDGTLVLQSGVTDMGAGYSNSYDQTCFRYFWDYRQNIRFEMGDSNLPPGPFQGGSGTTSTLGTAVHNVCVNMKKKLAELVKDNSVFHTELIHTVKARRPGF